MNTNDNTPSVESTDEGPIEGTNGSIRKPYERPELETSDAFESFTLQSCNQFPGECGGALE